MIEGKSEREWDKYDEAIAYLSENPEEISSAWNDPAGYEGQGGELFGFVGPDWADNANAVLSRDGLHVGTCGCLQQIRKAKKEGSDGKSGQMEMSFWPRLWDDIANDRRIPADSDKITVRDLPVFAEWQRHIDTYRAQL